MEIEEYDTDGLEIDILLYEEHGICNMKKLVTKQTHFDLIFDYVYDNKCMLCFSSKLCEYCVHCYISK